MTGHFSASLEPTSEARFPSSSPTPTIHTPPSSDDASQHGSVASKPRSPNPSSYASKNFKSSLSLPLQPRTSAVRDSPGGSDLGDLAGAHDSEEEEDIMSDRPAMHRPTDGRSHMPLLKEDRGRPSYDNGNQRPAPPSRRSTFRSRSPDMVGSSETRKKYTYAAFFLGLSLISFVIQTETAVYIQHELGWKKPYCML